MRCCGAARSPWHPRSSAHVQPLSLDKFGEMPHAFPAFTASVCNLRPTSRGFVRTASPDPVVPPKIQLNALTTEDDERVAVESLHLVRTIVGQPALSRYEPQEFRPGAERQSDEALLDGAREIGTTIFHPVGTAKMAADGDPMGVVDARLRVRGVEGLRVVDASVMPQIVSGNTNSPTIMIAEKGAVMILEDERK
jgi:choline dehydrogenase